MPAITLTLGVATCVKFVAEYLGLIENVAANTSRLRHEPLNSAICWFENAKNSKDDATMHTYLNDARREFMKATSLEEDENLVAAYAGLSACQYILGDKINARENLKKINAVELSTGAIIRATAKYLLFPWFIREVKIAKAIEARQEEFKAFRSSTLKLSNKYLELKA